jgi:hypothetical protein
MLKTVIGLELDSFLPHLDQLHAECDHCAAEKSCMLIQFIIFERILTNYLGRNSKWEFVTSWQPIKRELPNELWHVDLCFPHQSIVLIGADHVSRFVIACECENKTSQEVIS